MTKWFVYLIECRDESIYCGITTDISKRISEHGTERGAKYTRGKGPFKLIYKEEFVSHKLAAQRELKIKGLSREKKMNLVK